MKRSRTRARTITFLLAVAFAARAAVCAESTLAGITASGGVSNRTTDSGDHLGFWITIENHSKDSVSPVQLVRTPEDYDLEQICTFDSSQAKHCFDGKTPNNMQHTLATILGPGQTLAVAGELRAKNAHATKTLTAVISWQGPSPTLANSSLVVSLGDNEVQTFWYKASVWLFELFKSLAIPAVLAFLAWRLNDVAKRREEKREKAEKKREDIRHEHERLQTLRSETWKLLLPISHNYAAKYYLPVSSSAERAVQAFERANHKLAFFHFLMVLRRMSATTDEIGGFYFKDLSGERLAAKSIKSFRQEFLGDETDPFSLAMRASANLLRPHDTYERFEQKFPSSPIGAFSNASLQQAWDLFSEVCLDAQRMKKAMLHLTALYTVLDYESNRPYEYWYDSDSKVAVEPETEEVLRQLGAHANLNTREIEDYLTQMKK